MKRTTILFAFLCLAMAVNAQTVQQADSLHQRGRELVNEGKIAEGRECNRQAMEIRKKLLGEVSEDYINSLNNYALTFALEKDYAKAIPLQQQVLELCGKLKQPHKNIGMYTTNMGRFYYLAGDKAKAAQMWEQALPLVEKHGEIYEFLLNSLGIHYTDTGDQQAMGRIMALTEEHNQHELTKPCNEPKCMLERAQYYGTMGNQAMAKECFQNVIDMQMDDEMKITVFEAYAQFLAMTVRDRLTAAEYQYQAAMLRNKLKPGSGLYARSIYTAGLYYSFALSEDGYQKALTCLEQAQQAFTALNDAPMTAKCQQMKGNAYGGLKDFERAKQCYAKALAYYEQNDTTSKEYPKMIERVASMEKFNKEYDASIVHYRQAMQLFAQRGMMQEYNNAENALKLCYAYAGKDMDLPGDESRQLASKQAERKQLEDIIAQELDGLELTRTYLGKIAYARSLATIAGCHAMLGNYKSAVHYYQQYMPAVREGVREEFRLENETERMQTWDEEAKNIDELQELLVQLPDDQQQYRDPLAALIYDATLLSKGILLHSAIEFEKLLSRQNNPELTAIYRKTQANRQQVERLRREAATEEDMETILRLTQENQRLQTQLNREFREMDDFTRYISYSWKDVKNSLKDGDLSIEFANVEMGLGPSDAHMVALLLTKDMTQPEAVILWNEEDLINCDDSLLTAQLINAAITGANVKQVISNARQRLQQDNNISMKDERLLFFDLMEHRADTTQGHFTPPMLPLLKYSDLLLQDSVVYTRPEAGQIVWGRLASYLKGKQRVFFSPDGILHNMAIEYLPYGGKPFSEQFKVYRLSSTKELCYQHEQRKPTRAAIFGDINYNDQATTPVASAAGQAATTPVASAADKNHFTALRGSAGEDDFADLGNTRREMDSILTILKTAKVPDAESFRDTEASRTAFTTLSGSRVNLLHIATHGIYRANQHSTDTESMHNSLLAFAGANIDSLNLVSAAEIAQMNLRQCDLAVLSACETGLGKLGGDGVFGLQRGFKNAGVNTLLMSLKNVYDDSTADLMISFYRHLMAGLSKREALLRAQQELRAKGFSDPRHWAVFILLDALD